MHRQCRRLVSFVVLNLLVAGVAWAQTEEKKKDSSPPDPTGTWKWDRTFGENKVDFTLKLNLDKKKLTGKYSAFDQTSEIEDAVMDGDDVSFYVTREFNGNKFEVDFEGKVEKDAIRGTIYLDFGGEPREFEWLAKRSVEADDVLGTWRLHLDTPNGVVEPEITITKTDDGLHGEYSSPFGEREAKNLSLKDNELTWEISSDDNDDFDFKVVYHGNPRGNVIEGTNEYDFGGNTGTMEFTGKRLPPKEDQKPKPATKPEQKEEATEADPSA